MGFRTFGNATNTKTELSHIKLSLNAVLGEKTIVKYGLSKSITRLGNCNEKERSSQSSLDGLTNVQAGKV